ncbi:MAG: hypothetical protein SPL80_05450 [Bacilli bacterium]|nr:hypothetical protein [Bacilli bacterium]
MRIGLEEDFFVRDAHNLIPVEAKSRNGHSKPPKALIEGDKYPDVSWGIKLGDANIGDSGTIKTFPYFLSPQGLPEKPQMTVQAYRKIWLWFQQNGNLPNGEILRGIPRCEDCGDAVATIVLVPFR